MMQDAPCWEDVLELLGKGEKYSLECDVDDMGQLFAMVKAALPQCGSILLEENLNERLTVREYLTFFADLWGTKNGYSHAIRQMQAEDLQETLIRKLSVSQKRRVCFAREILRQSKTYVLQEPLRDLNERDTRLVLQWLERLGSGVGVLSMSASFKDVLLLPGEKLCFSGGKLGKPTQQQPEPPIVVDKISARKEDSVFLFNPAEIDWIESSDGKTGLYVKNVCYQCAMTLDDLEKRLARYGFYRCHRSYLVNMQKVREVVKWTRNSYSIKLEGAEGEIPLSKGRIEEMRELYHF